MIRPRGALCVLLGAVVRKEQFSGQHVGALAASHYPDEMVTRVATD